MARQTPPIQRLTVRQVMITVSIVALAYFAFKYGQNVLRYRELQAELARMEANISVIDAEQEVINRAFDESLAPATVDEFAKEDMNWAKKDAEILIPVGRAMMETMQPKVRGEASAATIPTQPENWRLWLEMLAGK